MTIMSLGHLNITGIKNKVAQDKKNSEVGTSQRLDTQEDELDLSAIKAAHQKQTFGVAHNIFDVSSYGEVNMKNMLTEAKKE